MIRHDKKSIVSQLENQGLVFTDSIQKSVGSWLPADADWNYRDIPHLTHIHSEVEGAVVFASDDVISSLFVQRIGPLKVILTVVLLASLEDGAVYFTSVGPFALAIQTGWTFQEGTGTTVTTTYSIGSPKFLKPLHRIIHKVLERNYRILMSEDLPMREQRAKLRAQNYTFRQDTEGHSFTGSLRTSLTNVLKPALPEALIKFSIMGVNETTQKFSNDQNDRHILVWINDDILFIGLTFCSHEGANLENQLCPTGGLICPWHGRNVKPLASFNTADGTSIIEDHSVISEICRNVDEITVKLLSSEADV